MGRGISSFRHPERSRGIFFVSRFPFPFVKLPEGSAVSPNRMQYGVSRVPLFSRFFLTANEKDFSRSLEMTIGEKPHSYISLLPLEGGAPKERRLAAAE